MRLFALLSFIVASASAARAQAPAPFVPSPLHAAAPFSDADDASEEAAARVHHAPPELAYVANRGQWPDEVLFQGRSRNVTAWVTRTGITYDFYALAGSARSGDTEWRAGNRRSARDGHVVRMAFDGGRARDVSQQSRLPGVHNYYLGNDAQRWAEGVPRYAEVRLNDMYPGVALRLYSEQRRIRYDVVAEAPADLDQVAFRLDGADSVRVTPDGDLAFETKLGEVRHGELLAYQEVDGRRIPIEASFVVHGNGLIGYEVEPRFPRLAVVIDPIVYSTYLGGAGVQNAYGLAVEGGSAYVTGFTDSEDFPTTPGAYSDAGGGQSYGEDVFITHFAASGDSLLYSTFFGGTGPDYGSDVALEAGRVYVTGQTVSEDFPTTEGAFQKPVVLEDTWNSNVFVAQFEKDAGTLAFSTTLGGTGNEGGSAIAVVDSKVYVVGTTTSFDFPTTPGAYQETFRDSSDVFVTQLAPDGTDLVFSTLLGGAHIDWGLDLAVEDETVFVSGRTESVDFPSTGGVRQNTLSGGGDAFVAALADDGTTLVYSTLLGGRADERANAIAVENGSAVVAGLTRSSDFPTTSDAVQAAHGDSADAFVARLSTDGARLIYSTFLGGSSNEGAADIVVDGGRIYVAGWTGSRGFPTSDDAYQEALAGASDMFLTVLDFERGALVYGTFVGGADSEWGADESPEAMDVDGDVIFVTGTTFSTDYPVSPSAFQQERKGVFVDAFLTAIRVAEGSVGVDEPNVPRDRATLELAGPNPFRRVTRLRVTMAERQQAKLALFDLLGREVAVLLDRQLTAGAHDFVVDGTALPAGVYVAQLMLPGERRTCSLTVLR